MCEECPVARVDADGTGLCRHFWHKELGIHKWVDCSRHGPCARDFSVGQNHTLLDMRDQVRGGPRKSSFLSPEALKNCKAPFSPAALERYRVTNESVSFERAPRTPSSASPADHEKNPRSCGWLPTVNPKPKPEPEPW